MVNYSKRLEGITAEHVLLVTLLGLSVVFYVDPILKDYPTNATVFPQLMAQVVGIGSFLLLIQNYLPGPIRTFVAEEVSMTESLEEERTEGVEAVDENDDNDIDEKYVDTGGEDADEADTKRPPLHEKWGVNINNTVIMIVFSSVYFALGWAAGFLYVTPLFVFSYTTWFRVNVFKGAFLAALATAIVYGFIVFLLMPFDQGAIVFTGGL
ncbi:tripartite tricarboxylate transporter TctB family protein [Halorubrum laminariae]|uniref:Tripartite tricarboxylate transporter TctB family protein n=1 Tax=Halorubrum laminariae TaxID=1433523 RepID=A0ABD6C481_9EURY|nr:tripartite tricarboxylate transporter TctB family protein [Halorubrum laminariae]